jgi:hypothetical protein
MPVRIVLDVERDGCQRDAQLALDVGGRHTHDAARQRRGSAGGSCSR